MLCALAPDLTWLLVGRVLQGIGAALLLPNSLALLNATFDGEERGRAIGIWAASGAAAAAVAPLIGGWLVDNVGWPAIFFINLPLAGGAILIAARFAAESRNEDAARTDYPGALLATLGLFGLTYGLTLWSAEMRVAPLNAALGLGGVALLALFLWVEKRRGDGAMMPLGLFGNRCFVGTNLLTFLLYGAFGAVMLLLPYVLIEAGGYSPLQAGLALTPLAIVIAIASPLMGKIAARIGGRLPLTAGPMVVAAGMLLATRIDGGGKLRRNGASRCAGPGDGHGAGGGATHQHCPLVGRPAPRRHRERPQQRGRAYRRTDRHCLARFGAGVGGGGLDRPVPHRAAGRGDRQPRCGRRSLADRRRRGRT